MYRPSARQALRLGLLGILVVLALGACGGGGQEHVNKPRPLPEESQALRPGEYHSEEFKPSLSFMVGEDWSMAPPETSEHLHLQLDETGGVGFLRIKEVYEPARTGTPNVVEAPEDMVGWFQHHPYLRTSEPKQVEVGGIEGEQFDIVVGDLPEGHRGVCGTGCVDLCRVEGVPPLAIWEEDKARVTALEDVEGETVTIPFSSPATEFDRFAPEAQKVIDSVKWRDS